MGGEGCKVILPHCVSVTRLLNLIMSPTSTGRRNDTSPISCRIGLSDVRKLYFVRLNSVKISAKPASTEHVRSTERQFKGSFHEKSSENAPAHVACLRLSHKRALRKLRANATLRNNSRARGALASFRLSLLTQREAQNCAAPASSPPLPFHLCSLFF